MGLVKPHFPVCFFDVWASGQVVPKLLAECPGITGQEALPVPWPVNPCLRHALPQGLLLGALLLGPPPAYSKPSDLLSPLRGEAPDVGLHLLHPMAAGCCLMVAVPRAKSKPQPHPGTPHSPLCLEQFPPAPQLLLLWPYNSIFFLRNLPMDTHRARAMVTVYLIQKRSW